MTELKIEFLKYSTLIPWSLGLEVIYQPEAKRPRPHDGLIYSVCTTKQFHLEHFTDSNKDKSKTLVHLLLTMEYDFQEKNAKQFFASDSNHFDLAKYPPQRIELKQHIASLRLLPEIVVKLV